MVDLQKQYQRIKTEIDQSIQECIDSAGFINGPKVRAFQSALEDYLDVKHVIPCGNGTDALQIALMALDLQPGDEVIVPAFTYVATAEVIALLHLKPVMVDVDPATFNLTAEIIEKAITPQTKAVVPVHLFGQTSDMEPIMEMAARHQIYVIEDNAQAIGSDYTFSDGRQQKAGTIGHIGTTSFYPSKNLGCYGDGGAMFTNDDQLAARLRMVANHGQEKRYYHSIIGVNSRLDAMQAAVLGVKLNHLNEYASSRQRVADFYDRAFANVSQIQGPVRQPNSNHVFHQYTIRVAAAQRDALKAYLSERGIPTMIYYPVPLYKQKAFQELYSGDELAVTESLCQSVLSLPIHTEMEEEVLEYICMEVLRGLESLAK